MARASLGARGLWHTGRVMDDPEVTIREAAAPPGRRQLLVLRVVDGPGAGTARALDARTLLIGRDPGVDLRIADGSLSRRHARVVPTGEGWVLEDLDSANGLWVAGTRVQAVVLGPGVRVRLGRSTLEVARAGEQGDGPEAGLLGSSPAFTELLECLGRVAPLALPVLIQGESGTGKEALARELHRRGPRAAGPCEVVDCTLLRGEHLRSELFGHVRGAFTGAEAPRPGAFVRAHGGTLVLDEVGELPLELQPALLRVLEEGEVRPLGGAEPDRVDVRVVSSTNRDLEAMVAAGSFRGDLYHRLAAVVLEVPPLRRRGDDILRLAEHFLPPGRVLSEAARGALCAHPWAGNVRELRHCLERAGALGRGERIEVADLALRRGPGKAAAGSPPAGEKARLEEYEAEAVRAALEACRWNKKDAARRLGIARSTLYAKMRRFGLLDD